MFPNHGFLIKVQWTLVMTNSSGPKKLLCLYNKVLLYQGYKNNKIQRKFEVRDQENYVITKFCYIRVTKTIKYKVNLKFGTRKIMLL